MVWVLATVALNIFAQIALKASSTSRWPTFLSMNALSLCAIALYGFGFLTWMKALKELPLSIAYPFMSLTTLLVPIISFWLLGERLSHIQWFYLIIIFIGVVGFAISGDKDALQT